MDLHEFYKLHLDDRMQLVLHYGRYLAIRREGQLKIKLYFMGKFFSEIWYNPEDNQPLQVRGFKESRHLEPYLDQVKLSMD